MYTYSVPFAVRSDSVNHSEIDKQVDTSLPTCVQGTDLQRRSHHQVRRYLLSQTDARIPSHSALGQIHRQVFCNAILHGF